MIETSVKDSVDPLQLETVNGVVSFNYKIIFAPKQFDKKMTLKITPKIQYADQTLILESIFLQGEKVKDFTYPVVIYDKENHVSHEISFDFKSGMEKAILWADIETMRANKYFMLSPVVLNKKGIHKLNKMVDFEIK